MDNDKKQKAAGALIAKEVNLPCPRCGKNKFSIVGETYISLQTEPGKMVLGGPSIPTVIVACNNCGYISQHAKKVLGLMEVNS